MKIVVKTCESKKGNLYDVAVLQYGKREIPLSFDSNVCSILTNGLSLLAQEPTEHVCYDLIEDND